VTYTIFVKHSTIPDTLTTIPRYGMMDGQKSCGRPDLSAENQDGYPNG